MAGSSMLTFWVLPYWNITPQALEMISHPVTLYWHWSDQFWFLALLKAECQAKEQLVLFLKSLVGLKEEIINLGENKKKKSRATNSPLSCSVINICRAIAASTFTGSSLSVHKQIFVHSRARKRFASCLNFNSLKYRNTQQACKMFHAWKLDVS